MKKKVLIVDDNSSNLYLLKSILTDEDFKVIEAKNGQEALEKAHALPEQCIFIDDSADNVHAARELNIKAFIFTTVDKLQQDLSEAGIALTVQG